VPSGNQVHVTCMAIWEVLMIQDPERLLTEFRQSMERIGERCVDIDYEPQPCPHKLHKLPTGKCAVYVFSLAESAGKLCPAGPNRVLKVGKAGPRSNARFQYQHYSPGSASSTLSGQILNSRILWTYLGISQLEYPDVGRWIRENTDRENFYLRAEDKHLLDPLERYIRGRLGPVFEGG